MITGLLATRPELITRAKHILLLTRQTQQVDISSLLPLLWRFLPSLVTIGLIGGVPFDLFNMDHEISLGRDVNDLKGSWNPTCFISTPTPRHDASLQA